MVEQDIINNTQAIVDQHINDFSFKYGPVSVLTGSNFTIDTGMVFMYPLPGGGDLGEGTAEYNFQLFVLTKASSRKGSVEKAYVNSELYAYQLLKHYKALYPGHRANWSNRQRINPKQFKNNALGFVFDFQVTVGAGYDATSFPSN